MKSVTVTIFVREVNINGDTGGMTNVEYKFVSYIRNERNKDKNNELIKLLQHYKITGYKMTIKPIIPLSKSKTKYKGKILRIK